MSVGSGRDNLDMVFFDHTMITSVVVISTLL